MKQKKSVNNSNYSNMIVLFFAVMFLACIGIFLGRSAPAAGQSSDEPVRVFSSYWGGERSECAHFDRCLSTVDQAGNIIIVGKTESDEFPLVNPFSDKFAGGGFTDLFVTKINAATKQVIFSTYLGEGLAQGVAVDTAGNIVVVGQTSDINFAVTDNAYDKTHNGGIDGVVVKLSSDGSQLLYSTFLGGSGTDELIEVVVDASNDIYVTGRTSSADYPVTFNPAQADFGGDTDIIVTKILSTGGLFYSTYLGGDRPEKGVSLAVDGTGSLFVVGNSNSDGFPTTAGVIQPNRASSAGIDATVTKLNPQGAIEHSTFYNHNGSLNNGVAVDLDSEGNIYVLTSQDGVIKLNSTLSQLIYRTEIDMKSGPSDANLLGTGGHGGIDVDSEGIAFVTGWVSSGVDEDVVLAALSASGRLIHFQTVGGSDGDRGYSIDLVEAGDGKKTAYIAGRTESPDFPTLNPIQANLSGGSDVLIVEITNLENIGADLIFLPLVVR